MYLENKKILFLASNFFGYDIEIKNKLEELGATVFMYDDRPARDFFTKAIIRVNKNFLKVKIDNYYKKIIEKNKNYKFDYIFVLKGETLNSSILKKLRSNFKNSEFILYLWDSIDNYKNTVSNMKYFHKVFSFDLNDSKKYTNIIFRPLFYTDIYKNINCKSNKKYDLCFIGSIHSDRYKIIKNILTISKNNNYKIYIYMYLQSRKMFYIKKLTDRSFRKANMNEFKFKSLPQNKVINIIQNSKVVLDIQHNKQTGLTIRTIETIGANKKLITTNKDIEKYDFFNSNNICIIDRENVVIDDIFFEKPYQQLDAEIYNKYSIETWLKDIFITKI